MNSITNNRENILAQLVSEFLLKHGITSVEDASDDLIEAAHREAESILVADHS